MDDIKLALQKAKQNILQDINNYPDRILDVSYTKNIGGTKHTTHYKFDSIGLMKISDVILSDLSIVNINRIAETRYPIDMLFAYISNNDWKLLCDHTLKI